MAKSSHPRLEQMVTEFGWTRGIPTESGSFANQTHARRDVEGRVAILDCWYPGSDPLWWGAGVLWGAEMSRRGRKQAIKQKEEILSLVLASELRRVQQEYLSRTADQPVKDQRKYGGGLSIRKAGIFFNALGEPPPASEIMTIVRHLADLAGRFETYRQ